MDEYAEWRDTLGDEVESDHYPDKWELDELTVELRAEERALLRHQPLAGISQDGPPW